MGGPEGQATRGGAGGGGGGKRPRLERLPAQAHHLPHQHDRRILSSSSSSPSSPPPKPTKPRHWLMFVSSSNLSSTRLGPKPKACNLATNTTSVACSDTSILSPRPRCSGLNPKPYTLNAKPEPKRMACIAEAERAHVRQRCENKASTNGLGFRVLGFRV